MTQINKKKFLNTVVPDCAFCDNYGCIFYITYHINIVSGEPHLENVKFD
jgi:hypothetical protein